MRSDVSYNIVLTNTSGTAAAMNTTSAMMATVLDLIDCTNSINCAGYSNSTVEHVSIVAFVVGVGELSIRF